MKELEKRFANVALTYPGMTLYDKESALRLINACERKNVAIFGIDGFSILKEGVQPNLDHSADFEIMKIPRNSTYSFARKFLSERPEEMYFEIVCDE